MASRLRYPEVAPEGYAALQAFGHYCNSGTALDPVLLGMVYLRASLLNGCEFCVGAHTAELRKHNEPESRIKAVASGSASEAFTPREQAALRWTDVLTRVENGPASNAEYEAVSVYFNGKDLVDLTFAIANINAWNRMGVAFRPAWRGRAGVRLETDQVAREEAPPPATASSSPKVDVVDDDGGKVATDE